MLLPKFRREVLPPVLCSDTSKDRSTLTITYTTAILNQTVIHVTTFSVQAP